MSHTKGEKSHERCVIGREKVNELHERCVTGREKVTESHERCVIGREKAKESSSSSLGTEPNVLDQTANGSGRLSKRCAWFSMDPQVRLTLAWLQLKKMSARGRR